MADNIVKIGRPRGEFCFQLEGSDKVWRMPMAEDLPVKMARKIAGVVDVPDPMKQIDVVCDFVEEVCPGLVETVTMAELMEIFIAWRGESVPLGE